MAFPCYSSDMPMPLMQRRRQSYGTFAALRWYPHGLRVAYPCHSYGIRVAMRRHPFVKCRTPTFFHRLHCVHTLTFIHQHQPALLIRPCTFICFLILHRLTLCQMVTSSHQRTCLHKHQPALLTRPCAFICFLVIHKLTSFQRLTSSHQLAWLHKHQPALRTRPCAFICYLILHKLTLAHKLPALPSSHPFTSTRPPRDQSNVIETHHAN